jgi:hypothetical protein
MILARHRRFELLTYGSGEQSDGRIDEAKRDVGAPEPSPVGGRESPVNHHGEPNRDFSAGTFRRSVPAAISALAEALATFPEVGRSLVAFAVGAEGERCA